MQEASIAEASVLKDELERLGATVVLEELFKADSTLKIVSVGNRVLSVGKLISKTTGRNLMEIMEDLEELPFVVEGLAQDDATILKDQFETLGASVEILGGASASQSTTTSIVKPVTSAVEQNISKPEAASSISSLNASARNPATTLTQPPKKQSAGSDSTLTAKFEENWRKLVEEAEKIKHENLLPLRFTDIDGTIVERTVEDFDAQLDNLKKEKFTISVCGMVKAGKSTFLNALLFGEDILPAFDTPMTAKLNFIDYSEEKNYFVVNYYNRDEWKDLLDNLDEENLNQLNARIEKCCMDHGIDQDEYIDAPPRKEMDLRKLEEFVSDPLSNKGKYTPFVKDVHIFIHNNSIKDVRIVDTPGLNDPNVINSRETTKWIKNTHALIFLLPNKGLDESSLKFFNTHLLGTRPGNRVWVINKIDDITEEDLIKTKNYIRQLGNQEEFKQKDLFGADERICGYSALIAMLRNMSNRGANLNEDQTYHLDNVGKDFNPDPDKLGNVIGERLYKNIGEKRITAGITAIVTIYSQHISNAEKVISACEIKIEDGQKSDVELQKEIDVLTENQQSFMNSLGAWKRDLESVIYGDFKESVAKPKDKGLDTIDRTMENKISNCNTAKELQNLAYDYRDACNKLFGHYGTLTEGLNECESKLRSELQETIKKIRKLFTENDITGSISFASLEELNTTIKMSVDDLINKAEYDIANKLPSNWFSELFTKKTTMRANASSVFKAALGEAREKVDDGIKDLETKIQKQISNSFNEFQKSIENSILQKRKFLESGKEERHKTLERARQELEAAKTLRSRVDELRRDFKAQFPQETIYVPKVALNQC